MMRWIADEDKQLIENSLRALQRLNCPEANIAKKNMREVLANMQKLESDEVPQGPLVGTLTIGENAKVYSERFPNELAGTDHCRRCCCPPVLCRCDA